MEGFVLDICFTMHEGALRLIGCLTNNLLFGLNVPTKAADNMRESIPDAIVRACYRKIDRGVSMVLTNISNGDIFASGDDKWLKKYDYPTDSFQKIDFRKPPNAPTAELQGHDLLATCWDQQVEFQYIATGGKDGKFFLRNVKHIEQHFDFKAHAVFTQGITAMCFSNKHTALYTAGGDGAFMVWTVGAKPLPQQAIQI